MFEYDTFIILSHTDVKYKVYIRIGRTDTLEELNIRLYTIMQTQLIKQLNSSSEDLVCANVTNNKPNEKRFLENIRQNPFFNMFWP